MNRNELTHAVEEGKKTVFKAIRNHLPQEMGHHVEDVAQETFLRYYLAFQNKAALSGDDLHRWLYVAARNECLRFARSKRREGFAILRLFYSFNESVEDCYQLEDEIPLKKHIEKMPEPYRTVTSMRAAGSSVREISSQLGISSGTVKSRLSRGREFLARSLQSFSERMREEP
jgi:RNA polymerase sigma-70 factor (ECF subfamily)